MTVTETKTFGIQRKIIANMTDDSCRHTPHVTYIYEADVTDFFAEYKRLNSERDADNKITFNTVILKVIAEALKKVPDMNAHITYHRGLVRGKVDLIKEINITMPMVMPNGEMMTVNLIDFGTKTLDEMSNYIKDVRSRIGNTNLEEAMFRVSLNDTLLELKKGKPITALLRALGSLTGKDKIKVLTGREKTAYDKIPHSERLSTNDLRQGTVMVTNFGSLYPGMKGAGAMLEIVPPQVSAFAIGAVSKKPVVVMENGEDKIAVRNILPICIAFDHRALDFDDIIPMIKSLDGIFEKPELIRQWEKCA